MTGGIQIPEHQDIVIARIVKARGIRGEVACSIETDFPERFESLDRATVWMPDDSRLSLKVEDHWFHKGRVILKFEGYDTMNDAQTLVGGRIVIAAEDALPLEEDEYYEYDLVGSDVETDGGRVLGRVSRLWRTGGTDLLVVERVDGGEYLIPFAEEICVDVDVQAKRLVIRPPEGLLDL